MVCKESLKHTKTLHSCRIVKSLEWLTDKVKIDQSIDRKI